MKSILSTGYGTKTGKIDSLHKKSDSIRFYAQALVERIAGNKHGQKRFFPHYPQALLTTTIPLHI